MHNHNECNKKGQIQFCLKLGKTATEMLECLKTVYGDEALKKTAIYDSFKRFKNDQESFEDEERSDRPSTSKNDETIEKLKIWFDQIVVYAFKIWKMY